jgi:microcystin degradation protein MlrC
MRIAVGCIGHETNTFSTLPTTIDSFQEASYYTGNEIIGAFKQTNSITGGFIEGARELDLELVPLLWTFAVPSGTIEQAAYDGLKRKFLDLLQRAGPLDGVLLDLHGAMVTEELEDAEGDLLDAVRRHVGTLPIVATLDLHANSTAKMAACADVIIGFDTYPHIDCHERGLEAIRLMNAILRGRIQPVMAYRQLPLLTPPPPQCTMKPPMSEAVERLHSVEALPGIVTATLSMGFPFSDIHDAGTSVLVTADRDQALAEQHAEELARYIWDRRESFRADLISVEEAIERAARTDGRPFVLAEGSDNPGGGAPCDGTAILRAFIQSDVQDAVVAVICDPESVARSVQAGVGNQVDLEVGGKSHPLHGDPVALTAYVKVVSDGVFVHKGRMFSRRVGEMGRTAVVKVGGVEIILTERRTQPFDAEVLRSVGIEPRDRKLIALKSVVHFRADYTPIAHEILEVDTPGVHSANLFSFHYQKLRRPIFPLDETANF